MGTKKQTEEPTSAAFNVTKQEKIAKKEIHIVGQRVKHYREKRGHGADGACQDSRYQVQCHKQLETRQNTS